MVLAEVTQRLAGSLAERQEAERQEAERLEGQLAGHSALVHRSLLAAGRKDWTTPRLKLAALPGKARLGRRYSGLRSRRVDSPVR